MYEPVRDGFEKNARFVRYTEERPPGHLAALVHCYWQLKTDRPLPADFRMHAMPDACVNILFNQAQPEIAAVTALRTRHVVLNLGRSFDYAGIQLLPGVWRGDPHDSADRFVDSPYAGGLPLVATSRAMAGRGFRAKRELMSALVDRFVEAGLVAPNPVTARILARLDAICSVADMAQAACLSARQLQRVLRRTTGFSPHDLLKVLRIQQSFRRHYQDVYADQSHYIHSFRQITGYTPARYARAFDV